MGMHLARMEKISLRERVGRALRAAIISGEMEPGVVYSAPFLGSRFGVSATPVREAMLDLVREDLVEMVPNKGFRVTAVSEADLDQITEIRLLLEPPAVRRITSIVPAADLPELRDMAQAIVDGAAAGDLVEYTEADRVFHERLLSYAGNPRLTELVSDLRVRTRLFGLATLRERGELVDAAQEHHVIVDTIAAGDEAAVESVMRTHISHVRGRWATPRPPDPSAD